MTMMSTLRLAALGLISFAAVCHAHTNDLQLNSPSGLSDLASLDPSEEMKSVELSTRHVKKVEAAEVVDHPGPNAGVAQGAGFFQTPYGHYRRPSQASIAAAYDHPGPNAGLALGLMRESRIVFGPYGHYRRASPGTWLSTTSHASFK